MSDARDPSNFPDLHELAEAMGVRLNKIEGDKVDTKALLATGEWSRQELPWMRSMLFDAMLDAFGPSEHHIIFRTTVGDDRRGIVLVSNQGRRNFVESQDRLKDLWRDLAGTNVLPTPSSKM